MNAYACYNNDEMIRMKSSSGGIYYLLAESVIKQGGVVFAACYNEDLDVEHCRIERVEDLIKSCGAKYVQSYLIDYVKNKDKCKAEQIETEKTLVRTKKAREKLNKNGL